MIEGYVMNGSHYCSETFYIMIIPKKKYKNYYKTIITNVITLYGTKIQLVLINRYYNESETICQMGGRKDATH